MLVLSDEVHVGMSLDCCSHVSCHMGKAQSSEGTVSQQVGMKSQEVTTAGGQQGEPSASSSLPSPQLGCAWVLL